MIQDFPVENRLIVLLLVGNYGGGGRIQFDKFAD